MSSTSIICIIVVILTIIVIDIFCVDVTNIHQSGTRQSNTAQKSPELLIEDKSTTPWPKLGRRFTENPNRNTLQPSRTTPGPKKWIQQNNIWIRNEQAASGGNVAKQNLGPSTGQSNRQQGSGGTQQGSVGNGQNFRGQQIANQNSNNRQVNRGNTGTNVNPQIHQTNRQQALINGLRGNQQNSGSANNGKPLSPVPSTPTASTNKPISYADVVGSQSSTPVPPKAPKSSASPPLSPQPGGPKKDAVPSTGPTNNGGNSASKQNPEGGDVTDDELREFSEMLLRKDTNNAMKYVTLNLQGMTTSRSSNDQAPLALLKIDPDAYKIPSIEKIMLLYNNYFLDAAQNEVYTGQERIEENNLLDTMLATPVMQYARSFLIQKGKIGKDPKEFKDLLRLLWFNMYSRGQGRIGSSAFEHIFLAEIKNNKVSGLHNWLYFNEEESQNRANYLGYLNKLDLGEKGAILKYHFTFHDIDKPVGSMFIGTSPELEMALYSTCFILRADRICPLKMNGNRFIIRTYTYRYRGKNMIGSAFPEI